MALALVIPKGCKAHQLGECFLSEHMEEEMDKQRSQYLKVEDKEDIACKLKKSLYRLKQTPGALICKGKSFDGKNES